MPEESGFEYDVAFSFMKDDEPTARHLASLLSERYKSFVYSTRQDEIVGTDGQETFAGVFGRAARAVVVLYRNGWGTTPWTRIEQTAIQDRAMREGWDFLLFIKLQAAAVTPKWLVSSYIWHDFERYGPVEAAGAISALIQRVGGMPHRESLQDKAARAREDIRFEERRRLFIGSEESVRAGSELTGELIAALKGHADELSLKFKPSRAANEAAVFSKHAAVMVHWRCRYANTTRDESYLEVTFWGGHPPLLGMSFFPGDEPPKLASQRYRIDLDHAEMPAYA